MGLKVWGSPVTPLYGGAFGRTSAKDRVALYASIPHDLDVLVTHGPPYGVLDAAPGGGAPQGDQELLEVVRTLRPKLHVFGHVHGANGMVRTDDTLFVNAALLGPDGDIAYDPIVLRMPRA